MAKKMKITIKHPGAFTKKAKAAGMSPSAFANKVMSAKKGTYSTQTRRQANFAKNFGGASHRRAISRRRRG